MRRRTRWFLAILLSCVLAVAGALASLTVFLNGQGLRERVEATLTHALGRPVSLGRLDLSLWTGSAVALDFRMADDPRFGSEPFVQAASVRLGIEMLPLLLRREVSIHSFALDRPSIRLVRDAAGTWNYASLNRSRGDTNLQGGSRRKLPRLAVSSIVVEDAQVLVRVPSGSDGDGATVRDRIYEHVNVKLKHFDPARAFPFQISAVLPRGGTVQAKGTAGPWGVQDASATPFSANVQARSLDLEAAGLANAKSGVSGLLDEVSLDLAWTERGFHVAALRVSGPRLTIDIDRRTEPEGALKKQSIWRDVLQRLSIDRANVSLGTLTVVRQGGARSTFRQTEVGLRDWSGGAADFVAATSLDGGGILRAHGRFRLPQVAGAPVETDAQVTAKSLDLARSGMLSPGSALAGTLDAAAHVQTGEGGLRVDGTARVDRLRVARNGQPSAQPLRANFAVVQAKHVHGAATRTGTIEHAVLSLGSATVRVSGGYRLGGPAAVIDLHATTDALPIDQAEAFLPTLGVQLPEGSRLVGGTVTTSLAVSGTPAQLVVDGPVRVQQTRLAGFDLGAKLASLARFTGGRLGSSTVSGTTIRSLSLNLHSAGGEIKTDRIVAEIAGVGTATGAGTVGESATLHFALNLKLDELVNGVGGANTARGFASQLPPAWAAKAMGLIDSLAKGPMRNGIPILVGGTARHPTVTPNLGALLPLEKPRTAPKWPGAARQNTWPSPPPATLPLAAKPWPTH